MTQATGGLSGRVSVLIPVKPASLSNFSSSRAASRDVSAVAPGQRGCDTKRPQAAHAAQAAELDVQIARAQAVREAISHGLRCSHEDITQCPNFNAGITARLAGEPLSQSHQQLHSHNHPH
jgi:hypothetical protein